MELSAGAPANPSSGSCTDAQGTWTGEEWRQQLGFDGFGNAWSVWLNGHWDPKAQGHSPLRGGGRPGLCGTCILILMN